MLSDSEILDLLMGENDVGAETVRDALLKAGLLEDGDPVAANELIARAIVAL